MNTIGRILWVMAAAILLTLGAGCSDRDPTELEVGRAKVEPVVFDDDYSEIVYYQPFFNTHYTAATIDTLFAYGGNAFDGARSLKFEIAPLNSALGLYTGGVLTSAEKRDLADFNALTFYARASEDITLNLVGFGNDNTGTSLYEAGRPNDPSIGSRGVPLTRDWSFVIVPIPAPSRLAAERGLFTIAESCEEAYPDGYDIWVDEIRYAQLSNIEVFRIRLRNPDQFNFIGSAVNISGAMTIFQVDGELIIVPHSSRYFDYESSDPAVATGGKGVVTAVGPGTATISAHLEGFEPDSLFVPTFEVNVFEPLTTPAAPPTLPAGDVISLFSDVYTDVLVDSWRADWSNAGLTDYVVAGDNVKMYTSFFYAGILFQTQLINASEMSHLHLDVNAPVGTNFGVEIVSFPGGVSEGTISQKVTLNAETTPPFTAGDWSSLDIPLSAFQVPEGFDWSSLGQMVISTTDDPTDARLVIVDNVYFHK